MKKHIQRDELTTGALFQDKQAHALYVVTKVEPGGTMLGQSFHTHYTLMPLIGATCPSRRTLAEIRRHWRRTTEKLTEPQLLVFTAMLEPWHKGFMETTNFRETVLKMLGK